MLFNCVCSKIIKNLEFLLVLKKGFYDMIYVKERRNGEKVILGARLFSIYWPNHLL